MVIRHGWKADSSPDVESGPSPIGVIAVGTMKEHGCNCMTNADLSVIYRDYIACLNKQDWPNLGQFVHEEVHYNGERIGLSGYREMLEGDFRAIPDLYFDIHLLICEPPRVASRLTEV